MKKFLFAVAALATSLTASAQLWVGGSLDFGNSKQWDDEKSKTEWGISPKIGYALDDALEVGLGFSIKGASFENNAETKSSQLSFTVAPFVRYTYFSEGNFSLFVEGNVSYYYYSGKREPKVGDTQKTSNWNFGANILPGFKYTLTDHFALVATFGRLSYTHSQPDKDIKPWTGDQNEFGFNISSSYGIGLYYTF
jgi:hypothetical protein